jgi:hypothetical protein
MKLTQQQLIQIIKEEVSNLSGRPSEKALKIRRDLETIDRILSYIDPGELPEKIANWAKWGAANLKVLGQALGQGREVTIDESGGVAGNFGGKTGYVGAVAGRATEEPDSPDQSTYGPEQTAEDNFVGILNDLGHMLDEWEQKKYPSDEVRYKSYFEDLQGLVEQYDPCAHVGQKCDEAHPNQSHEECIEVTINDSLYEVHSDKQRRWACAQADKPASKRKKSLSQEEAEEMCTGPMK